MTLHDIVKNNNYKLIMYRNNDPFPEDDPEDNGILFGYCQYIDGKLISLDGDTYSLNDIIYKYHYDEENDTLIVWQHCVWA